MRIQYNHKTNKPYEGRNQAKLLQAKNKNEFKSDAWLTFLQAKSENLQIIKGSKSVAIFKGFQKVDSKETDKNGKKKTVTQSRPMGFARVFNLDQTKPYTKNEG